MASSARGRNSETELMDSIHRLSNAGGSVIQVRTREPLRAALVLRKHFTGGDTPYAEWDVVNGFRRFTSENYADHKMKGGGEDFNEALRNPLDQLRLPASAINASPDKIHYFVFIDPHPYMVGNAHAAELIQQYAAILPSTNVCTLFVTPEASFPDIPAGTILLTELSTPTAEEIETVLRRITTESSTDKAAFPGGYTLSDDDIRKVATMALGLSLYEVETYAAISIIEASVEKERTLTLDRLMEGIAKGKTSVVRQSEILELTHAESIENVGGMGKLKDWVSARAECYSEDAIEFGIEPPKGIVLVGCPGTGKSLSAKAIASVLSVPLVRLDFGRVFSKYVGDCHAEETEFLTFGGIKSFHDITEDDLLATMNLETGELEYQKFTNRYCADYSGAMIDFQHNSVRALVTPGHRMLTRDFRYETPYTFEFADKIFPALGGLWVDRRVPTSATYKMGQRLNEIEIPYVSRCKDKKLRLIDGDTFLEFLGYFVSEGHLQRDKPGYICLSQNPGPVADRMVTVCEAIAGRVWVVESRGNLQITFSHLALWHWLNDNCGGYAHEKKLPDEFLLLPQSQLRLLVEALCDGDGSVDCKGAAGNFTYGTTSAKLAEQIEIIVLHLGMTPRSHVRHYEDGVRKPLYTIYASPRNSVRMRWDQVETVNYTGKIVCFTVPNSTLITRYKGTWLVSGNSESRVRSALKMVESMAPVVLFVDEIDKGLGGAGGGGDSGTSARVLGSYLTWLQECKAPVFNVVTANRVDGLPPELLRRGRFDQIFAVGMPSAGERMEVLAIHLRKRGRDVEDFTEAEVQEFVDASHRYVPAEIESAVKDALIAAFGDTTCKNLEMRHIIAALKEMIPMSKSNAAAIDAIEIWTQNNAISVSHPEKNTASGLASAARIIRARRS